MLPLHSLEPSSKPSNNKGGSRSPKKETYYSSKANANYALNLAVANNEGSASTHSYSSQQSLSPHSETITIVVMPCGREDGKNSQDEMPYEIKIRKKGTYPRV